MTLCVADAAVASIVVIVHIASLISAVSFRYRFRHCPSTIVLAIHVLRPSFVLPCSIHVEKILNFAAICIAPPGVVGAVLDARNAPAVALLHILAETFPRLRPSTILLLLVHQKRLLDYNQQ